MNIVKIVIKSTSGFCSVYEAYEDRITITPVSVEYEYKPACQNTENDCRKWLYKTTNKFFKELFNIIAVKTQEYLYSDMVLEACDAGTVTITAIFEDKHQETAEFAYDAEFFGDYFRLIKALVPTREDIPALLSADDDFEESNNQ